MMPRSKTTPSKIARVAARDVPNSNQTWKNVERITFNVKRYFEWTGSTSTMKRYYYAGGTRVAMRTGSSTLNYLLGDHLGSQSITTNSSGARVAEERYMPWGESRYTYGSTPTTFKFTGQRLESSFGLYFYNARWYDASAGRFVSADTVVPGAGNSQAYDRYAYTLNNPVRYTDPSGHRSCSNQQAATGDETCEQNYPKNELDYIIHMVLLGARYNPINSVDISEPENTAPSIINTILSVIKNGWDALTHNQKYKPDIFTWLTWNEYDDGSIGLVNITTNNYSSDATFYLTSVNITTKKDIFRNTPNGGVINVPQINDYRINPINSDYLFTSHPNTSQSLNLCIPPYICGSPNFERLLTVSITAFASIAIDKLDDPMYGKLSYSHKIPSR